MAIFGPFFANNSTDFKLTESTRYSFFTEFQGLSAHVKSIPIHTSGSKVMAENVEKMSKMAK